MQAGTIDDVLLAYHDVHPEVLESLRKLGTELRGARINEMKNAAKIQYLQHGLAPALNLVDEMVLCERELKNLDRWSASRRFQRSPADNMAVLTHMVAERLPIMALEHEVVPLFDHFAVRHAASPVGNVSSADQESDSDMKFKEENQDEEKTKTVTVDDKKKIQCSDLGRQVAFLIRAIHGNIARWMNRFPAPEVREWPIDYSAEEVYKVRLLIHRWITDPSNEVDLFLETPPSGKVWPCACAVKEDDSYPVQGQDPFLVVAALWRKEWENARQRALRKNAAQKELEEKSQFLGDGKGKKRVKDEDIAVLSDAEQPATKKLAVEDAVDESKSCEVPFALLDDVAPLVGECMQCFFLFRPCIVLRGEKARGENGTGPVCNGCVKNGDVCRLLCQLCAQTAMERGRGSGVGSVRFLPEDCEDCFHHEDPSK